MKFRSVLTLRVLVLLTFFTVVNAASAPKTLPAKKTTTTIAASARACEDDGDCIPTVIKGGGCCEWVALSTKSLAAYPSGFCPTVKCARPVVKCVSHLCTVRSK